MTQSEDDQFKHGVTQYMKGDYKGSIATFRGLTLAYPHVSQYWLNLGNALFKLNELKQAEFQWKKAIEMNPMETKAYLNLGNLYFKQENPRDALHYWEIFKNLKPEHAAVWLNLGVAYEKAGEMDKAWEHYEQYMKLDYKSPEVPRLKKRMAAAETNFNRIVSAANQALNDGDSREALRLFDQAFAAAPGSAPAYKAYGAILYKQKKLKEAAGYYLKAFAKDAEDAGALVNLGVIYEKTGQPIDALWAYQLARLLPSKDQASAEARFQELFAQNSKLLQKYCDQAWEALDNGKFEEAERSFRRLKVLLPLCPELLEPVAQALEKLNDRGNPKIRAIKTFSALAEKAEAEGRLNHALSFYEKYLAIAPDGPEKQAIALKREQLTRVIGSVIGSMLKSDAF